MTIIQHSSDIWSIPNFLSARACEDLIWYSEMKGYQAAEVSLSTGAKMMKNIRNNQRLLYEDAALAAEYWARIAPFCPATIDNDWQACGLNEQFRFYKYESAERFKRHIDGRFRRNQQEESRITFMIYLNDDFEGGHTDFDNVSIKPSTGDALFFIHEQKHEGCPVITGTKYVLRSDVMYRKNIITAQNSG
jgi:predicted 2-oxoglutarate/Fe(II)-dependent dioxygenase YbiX